MAKRFSYVTCSKGEIPSGVRFDVPARFQGQIVETAFGGFGRSENDYGDEYRRVTDQSMPIGHPERVTYAKRVSHREVPCSRCKGRPQPYGETCGACSGTGYVTDASEER